MTQSPPSHRPTKLVLAAIEPSGDELGAALIGALKAQAVTSGFELQLSGCGGSLMRQAGMASIFPIGPLSVMGFSDVARALPEARLRVGQLADHAIEQCAHAVVFVDGWAFSRLAAQVLRARAPHIKLYKYVAPQVWASRPQRKEFVKQYFDGVLTVLPFEEPIFSQLGVLTRYVGNPIFQKAAHADTAQSSFRLSDDMATKPLLAVLPGSRRREVERLLPVFGQTVTLLREALDGLSVVIPAAPAVEGLVRDFVTDWENTHIVGPDLKYQAIGAANVALAVSGTVTTEIAVLGVPQIIAYKVDALTHLWARRIVTTPYASILNVMAHGHIIPEFIQHACEPDGLAQALLPLLTDPACAKAQLDQLREPLQSLDLSGPPAAQRAASAILSWVGAQNRAV